MNGISQNQPLRRYLRVTEAADYTGLSTSTLAKLRLSGEGAPFMKAGRRVVVYDIKDLDAWLASRRRRSTSDPDSEAAR